MEELKETAIRKIGTRRPRRRSKGNPSRSKDNLSRLLEAINVEGEDNVAEVVARQTAINDKVQSQRSRKNVRMTSGITGLGILPKRLISRSNLFLYSMTMSMVINKISRRMLMLSISTCGKTLKIME
jgi:hypothetical protein